MKYIKICYKSGNITEVSTELTGKEIGKRIKNNEIDINEIDLSTILWGEVESISVWKKEQGVR